MRPSIAAAIASCRWSLRTWQLDVLDEELFAPLQPQLVDVTQQGVRDSVN